MNKEILRNIGARWFDQLGILSARCAVQVLAPRQTAYATLSIAKLNKALYINITSVIMLSVIMSSA
jgi:hypothetical protein